MSNEAPETKLYCYIHPDRETMLRCNRCDQPICPSCAILTPTGYRCKNCVRGQQKIFNTARWWDYPVAFVIAGALSFLGSLASSFLGFFTIFIAPIAGIIIAEAVRMAVRKRRSPNLYRLALAGTIMGALPLLLIGLFGALGALSGRGLGGLLGLLWPGLYIFLVASSAYYRLSGIRI